MMLLKYAIFLAVMAVTVKHLEGSVVNSKDIFNEAREDDGELSAEENIKNADKHDYLDEHHTTTKKPTIFQNIAQKLGFGKPAPFKKPLELISQATKPKPKPVVTKTKTVVLEITKRLTRHPICIASLAAKPPCSVVGHHGHEQYQHKPQKISYKDDSDQQKKVEQEETWVDDFKDGSLYIEPSSAVKMSGELATSMPTLEETESENDGRSGRYLSFSHETPAISDVKSVITDEAIDDSFEAEGGDDARYLFREAETKFVTKTMWVTKVQKVTDYKVTATLVPENCVPSELNFPHCPYAPVKNPLYWKDESKKDTKDSNTTS